jgi:hypothetical protein
MTTFFIVILLVIVIAVVGNNAKSKEIANLKKKYDDALRSGNKKAALDAGRNYYSKLRNNGKLTIYDEQAITNDLTAMK